MGQEGLAEGNAGRLGGGGGGSRKPASEEEEEG